MANADAWTRAVREGRIPSRRLATDAAIVQEVAELQPERVLDLGCGEGWLMRALAERGIETVGLDVSLELVMAAEETGGGRYRCCSYDELVDDPTRAGGPYDAIACNFSLLGADLPPLLRALRANLAPGGALVIQTVHPWTAAGEEGYADGWRTETFDAFRRRLRGADALVLPHPAVVGGCAARPPASASRPSASPCIRRRGSRRRC